MKFIVNKKDVKSLLKDAVNSLKDKNVLLGKNPIDPDPVTLPNIPFNLPPVNDDNYMPAGSSDLTQAAYALVKQVPDAEIKKFYRDLKSLVSDAKDERKKRFAVVKNESSSITEADLPRHPLTGEVYDDSDEDDEEEESSEEEIEDVAPEKMKVMKPEEIAASLGQGVSTVTNPIYDYAKLFGIETPLTTKKIPLIKPEEGVYGDPEKLAAGAKIADVIYTKYKDVMELLEEPTPEEIPLSLRDPHHHAFKFFFRDFLDEIFDTPDVGEVVKTFKLHGTDPRSHIRLKSQMGRISSKWDDMTDEEKIRLLLQSLQKFQKKASPGGEYTQYGYEKL